ncbi:MAG: hypothetical protein WC310_00510 [Patescibacteria group bacterium]|jgi:uncharacterized membrane protein
MENSQKTQQPSKINLSDNKTIAALSYIWVLFLIPLLAKREDKFCQFHAKQGLALFLVEVVGGFVFWIPLIGWALFLAVLVVSVVGILKALGGQYWEIPVLGEYAKKINL